MLLERVGVASARECGALKGNARNEQKTIEAPMESRELLLFMKGTWLYDGCSQLPGLSRKAILSL